ncbi:MAG: carbohydrate-binding domain-containing protein, partial [Ruminococcus sp.]|nr:carbohydrate-binding domain-containing protein [Ruminococcus sp.]
IHLQNDKITVEGDYAEVNGTTVTITHSGSFYIDGTLDDGQINVNIPDETVDAETVKLFLNGVSITGKSAPAILITNAENTSINLADGTVNTVSDGDTAYVGADGLATGEAVIEAKDDLTIKGGDLGTGSLSVTANTQAGIICNNDIKINGGVINVATLNAADETNGINGKKSLTVKAGTLIVDAEGDGIKSSQGAVTVSGGDVSIKAGNDAVQAETTIDISGGTLLAGGDRGLTAATAVNITGGTVIATATDNQVTNLTSANQASILLNCIDCADTTDLMWKKANAITVGDITVSKWEKKYKYVLLSDASIKTGTSYTLTNAATGTAVTHSSGASDSFNVTNSVTTFNNVDPAGNGTTVVEPVVVTDGYTITLSGTSVQTNAPSDVASVSGNVLTITKEGVFTVTGTSSDSQIVVDVDKTAYPNSVVELDLAGVNLTNSSTAPIYVASIGDEVQIVAKKGTDNVISDGTSHTQTYTDSDGNVNTVEGAIFARDDIKFKGSGNLTVNGNQDDAIVCKNDIKIYNGNITVNAVDDGIRGKDSVTIGDSTKSDGTPADNSGLNLTVKAANGDGIKSTATDTATDKAYGAIVINGGTIDITCQGSKVDIEEAQGGQSADGIQAEQSFVMNDGTLTIKTYQGSTYTKNGSSASTGTTQPGRPGQGGMGGMGGMQDGNSNKVTNSAKGIKAVGLYDSTGTTYQSGGTITFNGGSITIDSSDDAVHCAGTMNVYGGTFNISSADDGFHSDTTLNIGETAGNTFDNVSVFIGKCYEGVEAETINQNSGTVYIISGDDGYNAAGGNDSSGGETQFGPGGGGMQWGMGGSTGTLNLKGGLVVINSANGDHDAFDSNGNVNISGGYYCANGQEPIDCGDGGYSINQTGGNYITMTAGNTNLNTRYTFTDNSGKVIVSFMSASSSPKKSFKDSVSLYTGGTVSGGTTVVDNQSYAVYTNGTLSGGSKLN